MIQPNPHINPDCGIQVLSSTTLFSNPKTFHQNKVPSLARLQNGKILLSFVVSSDEDSLDSSVLLSGSTDNGNSWTNPRILYKENGWSCLNMGGLVPYSEDFIRLIVGKIKIDYSLGGDEPFSDCMTGYFDSIDGGVTWDDQFREIDLFPAWTEVYGQSNPHLLENGKYLMATMGTLGRDFQWHAGVSFCDPDDNYNFSNTNIIANDPERNYSDIDLTRLLDGRLLAVIREHTLLKSVYSHSEDEGKTWSPISYTGFLGSNIKLHRLNSGNVLCAYRDEQPENRGVSLSFSEDGGFTWKYCGQLYSAPNDAQHMPSLKCGYPDLVYINETDMLGVLHTYPDENNCMELQQFIIRDVSS